MMEAEIRWLQSRVENSAGKLVIVFFPGREDVYDYGDPRIADVLWRSEQIRLALAKLCSQQGIPYADLTAEMREMARPGMGALYYEGLDGHPTPMGYRIAARAVAGALERAGVLRD
jgi:lysophospholipase L1-like esterase